MRASSRLRFSSNDSLPKSIVMVHLFSISDSKLKNELYLGVFDAPYVPMLKLYVTGTRTLRTIAIIGIIRERVMTWTTDAYISFQIVNFALHDLLPFFLLL
jgi:hypothetical protein